MRFVPGRATPLVLAALAGLSFWLSVASLLVLPAHATMQPFDTPQQHLTPSNNIHHPTWRLLNVQHEGSPQTTPFGGNATPTTRPQRRHLTPATHVRSAASSFLAASSPLRRSLLQLQKEAADAALPRKAAPPLALLAAADDDSNRSRQNSNVGIPPANDEVPVKEFHEKFFRALKNTIIEKLAPCGCMAKHQAPDFNNLPGIEDPISPKFAITAVHSLMNYTAALMGECNCDQGVVKAGLAEGVTKQTIEASGKITYGVMEDLLHQIEGSVNEIIAICCDARDSGRIFEFVPGYFTWDEAQKDAHSRGGRLAVIRSRNDCMLSSDEIKKANPNLIPVVTMPNDLGQLRSVWVGLDHQSTVWKWTDGTIQTLNPDDTAFSNWGVGQPTTTTPGRTCVAESASWQFSAATFTQWYNIGCGERLPYVLEKVESTASVSLQSRILVIVIICFAVLFLVVVAFIVGRKLYTRFYGTKEDRVGGRRTTEARRAHQNRRRGGEGDAGGGGGGAEDEDDAARREERRRRHRRDRRRARRANREDGAGSDDEEMGEPAIPNNGDGGGPELDEIEEMDEVIRHSTRGAHAPSARRRRGGGGGGSSSSKQSSPQQQHRPRGGAAHTTTTTATTRDNDNDNDAGDANDNNNNNNKTGGAPAYSPREQAPAAPTAPHHHHGGEINMDSLMDAAVAGPNNTAAVGASSSSRRATAGTNKSLSRTTTAGSTGSGGGDVVAVARRNGPARAEAAVVPGQPREEEGVGEGAATNNNATTAATTASAAAPRPTQQITAEQQKAAEERRQAIILAKKKQLLEQRRRQQILLQQQELRRLQQEKAKREQQQQQKASQGGAQAAAVIDRRRGSEEEDTAGGGGGGDDAPTVIVATKAMSPSPSRGDVAAGQSTPPSRTLDVLPDNNKALGSGDGLDAVLDNVLGSSPSSAASASKRRKQQQPAAVHQDPSATGGGASGGGTFGAVVAAEDAA